jgi:arylsulfatase A-like enzyme
MLVVCCPPLSITVAHPQHRKPTSEDSLQAGVSWSGGALAVRVSLAHWDAGQRGRAAASLRLQCPAYLGQRAHAPERFITWVAAPPPASAAISQYHTRGRPADSQALVGSENRGPFHSSSRPCPCPHPHPNPSPHPHPHPHPHRHPPPPPPRYHDTMIDHDRVVGKLLDLLDTLGLADSTIVQYTTDNGEGWRGGRADWVRGWKAGQQGSGVYVAQRCLIMGGLGAPLVRACVFVSHHTRIWLLHCKVQVTRHPAGRSR